MSNNLKGNAVIGQSGGPTSVINQSLVGVVREAKKAGHILDLLGDFLLRNPTVSIFVVALASLFYRRAAADLHLVERAVAVHIV
jgi:hypothetical protein